MTEEERKRFYAKISRLDFAGPDRWETWDLGEGMTFLPSTYGNSETGSLKCPWQVSPDGRYYMDGGGFGMSGDVEETLFGYIDRNGDVVAPFTCLGCWPGTDFKRLRALREQAICAVRDRKGC